MFCRSILPLPCAEVRVEYTDDDVGLVAGSNFKANYSIYASVTSRRGVERGGGVERAWKASTRSG